MPTADQPPEEQSDAERIKQIGYRTFRLQAQPGDYLALPLGKQPGRGFLVNCHGRGVQDMDTAWDTILRNLGCPAGRAWRSYLPLHSVATLVGHRGATLRNPGGFMGLRASAQTEIYAMGKFPTASATLRSIISEIEKMAPGAFHRTSTGDRPRKIPTKERKMSG